MVAPGINGTTFADSLGNKTGSYPIKDNAAALKDASGAYSDTAYLDVIVMSNGLLAGGASSGSEGAPNGDFTLTFYVDDTLDYNPSLVYDPTNTDPNHATECLKKFYSDAPTTQVTGYTVKGSDLEIGVEVEDTGVVGNTPEFWSINKAMAHQEYADCLFSEGSISEALDNYEKSAENITEDFYLTVDVLDSIAACKILNNQTEEGLSDLERLVRILTEYKATDSETKFQLCNNLFCILDAESEEEVELREKLMERVKGDSAVEEYVHNFLTNAGEK